MKQKRVLLLALAPLVAGCLYNWLFVPILAVPLLADLWFWLFPAALLVLWFWAGRRYSVAGRGFLSALLLAHVLGFLCLAVYLWQFLLVPDGARSMLLAVFSQSYAPVNTYTSFLAIRFEPDPHVIGQVSQTAGQVLNLLLMMVVFSGGYWFQRRRGTV